MDATENPRPSAGVAPNINVTPLIDVLLVLLIIFMVLTPLRPSRFKTMTPAPPRDNQFERVSPRTLVVAIDESLHVKLILGAEEVAAGSVADASAITTRLAEEWKQRKARSSWRLDAQDRLDLAPDERIERTVFIRAPRSVGYGEVTRVIDGVKGAGARPVGLQTDELPD